MTGDIFNLDEVFEIACQIERNGAEFYRRAAEMADDPGVRPLLENLSDMEAEHERRFAELRARLVPSGQAAALEANDEPALYLRAIASGLVFEKGGGLTGHTGVEQILGTAIRLEKESIVLYVGIMEAVPENLGRDSVNEIIREEMGHITVLSRKLSDLRQ